MSVLQERRHGNAGALVAPADDVLAHMSKAEMSIVIRRMLARHPDLETLLDLPIPSHRNADQPVQAGTIRDQVNYAFRKADNERHIYHCMARHLSEIIAVGDAYLKLGNLSNAQTVYGATARGILENDQIGQQGEGEDLRMIIRRCIDGLGNCLDQAENATQRETALRALFDIYRWNIDHGGIDIDDYVPNIITARASQEEKRRIAGWVRDTIPHQARPGDDWRKQAYGAFLLKLEEGWLDNEAFLDICRTTGRINDLVDRLVSLGRLDEAIAAARAVDNDHALLSLADIFVEYEQRAVAEKLVRERTQTNKDHRLLEWLRQQAIERGDLTTALDLTEEIFWRDPCLARYEEMHNLAEDQGTWENRRQSILTQLAAQSKHTLLTEIYLDEGLIDAALDTLVHLPHQTWAWDWFGGPDLRIRVAEAAEISRPYAAIRLYLAEAERILTARAETSYHLAVNYLVHVRALYLRVGQPTTWESYITGVRTRARQLPALRVELERAGL